MGVLKKVLKSKYSKIEIVFKKRRSFSVYENCFKKKVIPVLEYGGLKIGLFY
jgi:hypothetical protein